MTDDNVVITVDKDVPRTKPKRRRGVDETDPRVQQLRGLELDDSFFLEGKTRKDVRPLVDLGKKIDVFLIHRETECDEIYQKPGVRLWRVKEEEMPRYKPKPGAEQLVQQHQQGAEEAEELEEDSAQHQALIEEDDDEL